MEGKLVVFDILQVQFILQTTTMIQTPHRNVLCSSASHDILVASYTLKGLRIGVVFKFSHRNVAAKCRMCTKPHGTNKNLIVKATMKNKEMPSGFYSAINCCVKSL